MNIPSNHYKISLNHSKIPLNPYNIPSNHYKNKLNHYINCIKSHQINIKIITNPIESLENPIFDHHFLYPIKSLQTPWLHYSLKILQKSRVNPRMSYWDAQTGWTEYLPILHHPYRFCSSKNTIIIDHDSPLYTKDSLKTPALFKHNFEHYSTSLTIIKHHHYIKKSSTILNHHRKKTPSSIKKIAKHHQSVN